MEKRNYILMGFLFYIGFELARTIDTSYRAKAIEHVKNFILKAKED